MKRQRFEVVVTIRRFEQPAYTYTFAAVTTHPTRTVEAAAWDTATSLTRDWHHSADIRSYGKRATVRSGSLRAYVRALRRTA